MLRKIFNWIIDKWLAGFITAAFFFMLKLYNDLPEDKKSNFLNFDWLKSILQTDIALWKVFILISFVVIMFWIRNWWRKQKNNLLSENLNMPDTPALNYKVDTFGVNNAKWTWDYEWYASERKIDVKDVLPLCPVCNSKMELSGRYSSNTAICVKCRLEGKQSSFNLLQWESDVTKEIIRRLNTGEWQSKLK